MTEVVDHIVAAAVAAGYAFVGAAALGRTPRKLAGWSEAFLIGAGACAAALFPLSLLAPRRAVDAELGLLVLATTLAFLQHRRRSGEAPARPGGAPRDPVATLLLALVVGLFLFFAAFNLHYGHSWDSVQVYGTRAKMLFHQGGLSRWWFPESAYDSRLIAYPPMISLTEALVGRLQGTFEFDRLKPIFAFFYAALLASTYAAARSVVSRRWALGAALLVALLPELTTGTAAAGYVDMPLAAFVAAIAAASLRPGGAGEGWRSPLPWLLGGMTAVKQEGMVLALVGCAAIALCWVVERPRRLAARVRANWTAAGLVLAFVASRVGYVRWTRVHDATWGPFDTAHLVRAAHNVGLVASLCLRYLLDPRLWGLFWPAFLLGGISIAASGPTRLRVLGLAVAASAALDAGLFLFTNWPFELHIEGAYSRLLAQLAPAASTVIVFAASRIWSRPETG